MIQRIQTLYLLIVAVLTASMFFFPFLTAVDESGSIISYNFNGIVSGKGYLIEPLYVLTGMIITCLMLSLASIFMFKKRILQIRVSTLNIILFLFTYIIAFGYFFLLKSNFGVESNFTPGFSSLVPLLNIILTYLAVRSIGADEALVKSLNRLR